MQRGKQRRTYPTLAQKARMIAILDSDKLLQRGKFTSTFTKREAEKRWRSLADNLNAIPGAKKGWMAWRKTWQDMKAAAKKKHNAAREEMNAVLEGTPASTMSRDDLNVLETMATMLVSNADGMDGVVEYDESEREMEKCLINLVRQQKCLWHPDDPNFGNKRLKDALWVAIARHISTLSVSPMTADATQRKWKSLKDARAANIKKLKEQSENDNVTCKVYKYAELMSFLDEIDIEFCEQYIELVLEETPGDPLDQMYDTQASNSSAQEPEEPEDTKTIPPPLSPAPPSPVQEEKPKPSRYRQRLIEEQQKAVIRRGLLRVSDPSNSHLDSQNDSDSTEVILQELRRKPDDHHTQFCLSLAPIMRSLPMERVIAVRIKILQFISESMNGNSDE